MQDLITCICITSIFYDKNGKIDLSKNIYRARFDWRLDVFGMPPFGDESIIDKLNSKKLIRIFVYNKNKNDETKVWESKLKCKYELLESSDIRFSEICILCRNDWYIKRN